MAAFEDETEEDAEGLVEEGAVAGLVGGEGGVFEIAEAFEGIPGEIFRGLHGGVAELRAGFQIEDEEKAIEVAEAGSAEFVGELLVVAVVEAGFGNIPEIPDGFVAEEFDGLADGVLEFLGDGEGVAVGVVVEGIVERLAFAGADAIAVEEGGGGAQGVLVLAGE